MKAATHISPIGALLIIFVAIVSCSRTWRADSEEAPSMNKLVFLTREGCVNTVTMRANLDDALRALHLPTDYQFIDADTLAESDPRGGYGTPTVLYARRDLFGMSEPPVPHPPAS